MFGRTKTEMVGATEALPGRASPISTAKTHFVFSRLLSGDIPKGMAQAMFGMGCFWGVERIFWRLDGVWVTRVGYASGYTENPTYEEVCSGRTGHNEVVHLVFDPKVISYGALLRAFWEGHDPTQGMGQGNDRGTQYRSGIYVYDDTQSKAALESSEIYGAKLKAAGLQAVTTEIVDAPMFFHAEEYHQQYLAKNPGGYCGLGGTGVSCPIGIVTN